MQDVNEQKFEGWFLVEVKGFAAYAGFLTECNIAGHGFLRVDVPGKVPFTKYIAPSSIHLLTPCDEQSAKLMALRLSAPAIPANVARLAAPVDDDWR